jgi:hypothetical protein
VDFYESRINLKKRPIEAKTQQFELQEDKTVHYESTKIPKVKQAQKL